MCSPEPERYPVFEVHVYPDEFGIQLLELGQGLRVRSVGLDSRALSRERFLVLGQSGR